MPSDRLLVGLARYASGDVLAAIVGRIGRVDIALDTIQEVMDEAGGAADVFVMAALGRGSHPSAPEAVALLCGLDLPLSGRALIDSVEGTFGFEGVTTIGDFAGPDLMGHAILHDVARGCAYSATEVRELASYRLRGEVMGAIVGAPLCRAG